MIDLDNFKQVNDTFGHVTGDRVLSTIAEIARTATRESDIAGRYGGDEICVVLPEITLEHTQAIAERICNQIANIAFAFGPTLHHPSRRQKNRFEYCDRP